MSAGYAGNELDGEETQQDAYTNMWPALDHDHATWGFDEIFENEPSEHLSDTDYWTAGHRHLSHLPPALAHDDHHHHHHHQAPPQPLSNPSSSAHFDPPPPQHPYSTQRRISSSNIDNRRARTPAADHSNNWLDQAIARHQRPSEDDHRWPTLDDDNPQQWPSASPDAHTTANVTPSDHLSEEDMPPTTRGRTQPRARAARGSIVDLTADLRSPRHMAATREEEDEDASTPPRHPHSLKRAAATGESASHHGPPSKRRHRPSLAEVEEMDLTNEGPSIEDELLEQQKQQQEHNPAGPLRLGKRQCIICMEPYNHATVTACGHIYCHECLHQALRMGEKSDKGVGACPVCRKTVNRKKAGSAGSMVVVNFMRKSAFERKGRKL